MSRFDAVFEAMVSPTVDHEFGVTVTVTRGVETTAGFTARRRNDKAWVVGADMGFPVKITRRIYTLPRADYDFGDGPVEPKAGDKITDGSTSWLIAPPDDDTPAVLLPINSYEWDVHVNQT